MFPRLHSIRVLINSSLDLNRNASAMTSTLSLIAREFFMICNQAYIIMFWKHLISLHFRERRDFTALRLMCNDNRCECQRCADEIIQTAFFKAGQRTQFAVAPLGSLRNCRSQTTAETLFEQCKQASATRKLTKRSYFEDSQ